MLLSTRLLLVSICVVLAFSTKAQRIRSHFRPSGCTVKLAVDSLFIYTDTSSIFQLYTEKKTKQLTSTGLAIRELVAEQLRHHSDTVVFSAGRKSTFLDNEGRNIQVSWNLEETVLSLLKKRRVLIYDKHCERVKAIITKVIGSRKQGWVNRLYINKDTKEKLFTESVYFTMVSPSF